MSSFGSVFSLWSNRHGFSGQCYHLSQLWQNWDMVMGKLLAPLVSPLGKRKDILVLGVEDHMLMQDMTYAVPEILERVNAFMDVEMFAKAELRLLGDKVPLNRLTLPSYPLPPAPVAPDGLGGLVGVLDPNSPVGRCYAAYVNFFRGAPQ